MSRFAREADLGLSTSPPPDVPGDVFAAALTCYLEQRRLDMGCLAQELGIARATLYRRSGSRERLLGEVVWFLCRRQVVRALRDTVDLRGAERIKAVTTSFMTGVSRQVELRRLLDAEPEAALRILTSKHGPVQRGLVDISAKLIAHEAEREGLDLALDPATLAYVIIRVGEGFLYADVIGHGEPDLDSGLRVIDRLVDATVTSPALLAA
jgi:AcrR family transcriptional regulator